MCAASGFWHLIVDWLCKLAWWDSAAVIPLSLYLVSVLCYYHVVIHSWAETVVKTVWGAFSDSTSAISESTVKTFWHVMLLYVLIQEFNAFRQLILNYYMSLCPWKHHQNGFQHGPFSWRNYQAMKTKFPDKHMKQTTFSLCWICKLQVSLSDTVSIQLLPEKQEPDLKTDGILLKMKWWAGM